MVLLAAEARRALLDERSHALGLVLSGEELVEEGALAREVTNNWCDYPVDAAALRFHQPPTVTVMDPLHGAVAADLPRFLHPSPGLRPLLARWRASGKRRILRGSA